MSSKNLFGALVAIGAQVVGDLRFEDLLDHRFDQLRESIGPFEEVWPIDSDR